METEAQKYKNLVQKASPASIYLTSWKSTFTARFGKS